MDNNFKKSAYLYLCALMGILLFLVLHRIIIFVILLLALAGFQPFLDSLSSLTFMGWEYLTLIIFVMLGAWYGIWVGMYWFGKVYEEKSFGGFVHHVANNYWPRRKGRHDLQAEMEIIREDLEKDMVRLKTLEKEIPTVVVSPQPAKKRVIRKRVSKKVSL